METTAYARRPTPLPRRQTRKNGLVLLSQKVAAVAVENQIIEEIQIFGAWRAR
jgi:hypothetical protein